MLFRASTHALRGSLRCGGLAPAALPPPTWRSFSTDGAEVRPEPHSADSLMQIGTRAIFSPEHDQFREMVRNFMDTHVKPYHAQWEKDGQVSREVWKQAGEHGLLGVTVPEEYGGINADILYSAVVWEEIMYANASGLGFSLHSEICIPYLINYGTEEQKHKYLPGLVSGDLISCIAMTEPGAGSDLAGTTTRAESDGDHYVINGSKTYITNGAMADLVFLVVTTDKEKGAHGKSIVLVEAGTEGFARGANLEKMGMKAQDTSELFFENCRVPKENLLGPAEGKGFYQLMGELPQERLLIADIAVASAEFCFEKTREFCHDRKAFGKSIDKFQVNAHKLAEIKTDCAVGRAFVDNCLYLHSHGKLSEAAASMAKYWCTDLQNRVADNCVQLHGGAGYMWEYDVCRVYADARVQQIYGGTNEIMKELIARTI